MNVSLFVKDLLAPDEFGDCDFDGYDAMVYLVDFYKNGEISYRQLKLGAKIAGVQIDPQFDKMTEKERKAKLLKSNKNQ